MNYCFSKLAHILNASFKILVDSPIQKIYIDTREIFYARQALFIALKGTRDGNHFVLDAYNKGIRYFLLSSLPNDLPDDANYLLVENTLIALQKIATFHRNQHHLKVIAITGSNGKTIVKEWLNIFLSTQYKTVKSPKSFNSQIGVPLSILEIHKEHEVGIFEAGISQPGEMLTLEAIIQPHEGILTHMGDAHQEHFNSFTHKLLEKLKLFQRCKKIYATINDENTYHILHKNYPTATTISKSFPTTYHYQYTYPLLTLIHHEQRYTFQVPFHDNAHLENLALCLMICIEKNIPTDLLQKLIPTLPTLPMRLELITDNQEFNFIIDTWSSDFDSLQQALYLLQQTTSFEKKKLVLTDFENLKLDSELFQFVLNHFLPKDLYLIGHKFQGLKTQHKVYKSIEDFMERVSWEDFVNTVILLKGARKYELEKVYHFLNLKASTTYLKINLQQLKKNLGIYKSLLKPSTKIMVMLKADSYGSGSWEIAKAIESQVDYIGVAFTVEGIALRKKGVTIPIMVMNPDANSPHLLKQYHLEPVIGTIEWLKNWEHAPLRNHNIHIEIETGMNRLGFLLPELKALMFYIQKWNLQPVSLFTHFASADQASDDNFTRNQYDIFQKAIQFFHENGYFPICHCLNTAGIERFPEFQMDMVRLGIGLYGISENLIQVQEIGKMYSKIIRIHEILQGQSIGYNRSFIANKNLRIATVPIGYADGLKRSLSNGNWYFKVQDVLCPIVGKICMDMTMIDITQVPNVKVGDEVLIFGEPPLSIHAMSQKLNTIPYECLVGIPSRVKRIFVEE